MTLASIQIAFSQAIYENESFPLKEKILSDPHFNAEKRIQVYRHNTLGILKSVLQSVYPICTQLLGERYFQQLAMYHVNRHPSKHRNLDDYGQSFPETLAELIKLRPELQPHVYLEDLAQLEWYLHHAYYSVDRTYFDIKAFALLSTEQQLLVHFTLAKDIHLIASDYPLFAIWQSHQDHENTEITGDTIDWNQQWQQKTKQYLLVVRENFQPTVMLIKPALYHLLTALKMKKPLLALNRYLVESPVELSQLIQRQWIIAFQKG